jgi:WD40 repeat protein
MERMIPIPLGPGNVGKIFAVAISPDGATIAAGGWTRTGNEQIYLFERASGRMLRRIGGLPNVVFHLVFSPDGGALLATLGDANGIRLLKTATGEEIARDVAYGGDSYGGAFARDGGFVTTGYDGALRLYAADGTLLDRAKSGHDRPFGVAIHPSGDRVAVGFDDATDVRVFSLSGDRLRPLHDADTSGVTSGDLSKVAWSRDGATLFAGGRYDENGAPPALAWAEGGFGALRSIAAGRNTIMSLVPLQGSDLLIAGGDPWLGRVTATGAPVWTNPPAQADFRSRGAALSLSADGAQVGFEYEQWGADPAWFDTAALRLTRGSAVGLSRPEQTSLKITDWVNTTAPKLDGAPLALKRYEMSRALAIHPGGARFVLGTEWSLRAFSADGAPLWRRDVPSTVWAVNISADGRHVVAAYADGTIRWHRADDGAELLAFFPCADRENWVAWAEHEGAVSYAATPGAYGVLRWQSNKGWDETPRHVKVASVKQARRRDVITHILARGGYREAMAEAEIAKHIAAQRKVIAHEAKGALHILTIGVSEPGAHVPNLALRWAAQDAEDLCAGLENSQDMLWRETPFPMVLTNGDATKTGILRALAAVQDRMADGDLAVIHFSGHGAQTGGGVFLLPHGLEGSDDVSIRAGGLSVEQLRDEVMRLAERGRVLLTLDCCHAGGMHRSADGAAVRAALAQTNVAVLTGCAADEVAVEREDLRNGAFTAALLWALREGDHDGDGLMTVGNLIRSAGPRLEELTERKQRLGHEDRFGGEVFVATGV